MRCRTTTEKMVARSSEEMKNECRGDALARRDLCRGILLLYKLGISEPDCSIGSCETVNLRNGRRSSRTRGRVGRGFYRVMFVLSWRVCRTDTWIRWGCRRFLRCFSQRVAFSAGLTYLELFVIHAICQWCGSSRRS